jgi:uncharacterized repeat protein (TIGR01451 family)
MREGRSRGGMRGRGPGSVLRAGVIPLLLCELVLAKSATYLHPEYGSRPVEGAVITYTLTATVNGEAALGAVVRDAVPPGTAYVPGSITVNGVARGDGTGDGDGADYGVTTPGDVTVVLGDLTPASPAQTITFQAIIQ